MSTKWTDSRIKALKLTGAPSERYEKFAPDGLGIRVGNKSKSFIFLYRFRRKPRRMTLGRYPEMGLADARLALAEAKKKLEQGKDPGARLVEQRRLEREAETIKELANLYVLLYAKVNNRTWREDERKLNVDIVPALGHLKVKDVTRRDITALIDQINERGARVAANRTISLLSRMFRFAISRGIVDASPVVAIERNKERPRERTLNDEEIKRLWLDAELARMSRTAALALKFILATGVREGEAAGAQWSEIDGDAWEIPSARFKSGRPHRVPLSNLALELLADIREHAGDSVHLFPSRNGKGRHIDGGSIYNATRVAFPILRIEGANVHDLRRTFATKLGEIGIERFIIGRLLGHAEQDVTGQHYDKYGYEPQKLAAMERWGVRLREIVEGEKVGKVVELGSRK